ncbi:glycosyl hydrolases family 31-domain-containing protein [Kockiozyma suomiensis]|uniref:glycosyl hydrolases family 31-domain-containing protein n=1 Tax=Kockiozyma suomiensis TaxID=1337062 RepID=UPI00334330FB
MKISHGCWHPAADTIIDWAVEVVKTRTSDDELYAVTCSKPLNFRGDTLNNPTLSHSITSPANDILYLSSTHWKAQASTDVGPHFELFPDGPPERTSEVSVTKDDNSATFSVGNLSAELDTRPKSFNLDFYATDPTAGKKKLLTKLGWRSVGYVKQGTTAAHPKLNYTDPNRGTRYITYQLQLGVGEKLYGLGERFGPFVKNGQSIDMWNDDGGTGSELTYKNIPFFLSSKGYGVFIPSSSLISYEIQSERTTRVNILIPGEQLSMYLIHGPSPKAILEKYTTLTGRPALPPKWTFGLWLSTSFTTEYDATTVNQFLDGMKERDIPVSVFHYDCFWMKGFEWCDFEFDKDYFPDAASDLKALKERGLHICVWINPYIAQESSIFDEGASKGYFIKKADGSVWQYDYWQAGMGFVDFTNPEAWNWYQEKLGKLIDLGVDSFKTDFGERIPTGDAVYFDGSDPAKMHNYYPFLYNKATFEVIERKLGKNEAAVFARSATAGVQRFPVHWGGDPYSTFEAMAETLRGGLSLALSGFGYWAHDIGGFEGNPDPALYKRWIAFGLMSSHSRLHGSNSYRVPWIIDPTGEAEKVLAKFVKFKHTNMPYLFAQARIAHNKGIPMLRATFLEFPDDASSWTVDTQYFLGSEILVAPVFNGEGDVEYYIPETKGQWYGLFDGKLRTGGKFLKESHDFFSLPSLLKPSGAIVRGAVDDKVDYDWASHFTLLVNASASVDEKLIDIPNWEDCGGDNKVSLKLSISETELVAEVIHGTADDWSLSIVAVPNVGTVTIDGVVSYGLSKKGSEFVLPVTAGAKKVSVGLN